MRKIFPCFLVMFLFLIPFAFALGVNIPVATNYSVVNVNNSQYLQGYTPTTLKDWIQGEFNSVYAGIQWGYNQTYSGSTYNATYETYSYNFSSATYTMFNTTWSRSFNTTYDVMNSTYLANHPHQDVQTTASPLFADVKTPEISSATDTTAITIQDDGDIVLPIRLMVHDNVPYGDTTFGDNTGAYTVSINANSDAALNFNRGGTKKWTIGNDASDDGFHINQGTGVLGANDAFTILTNKYVGIGTATPMTYFEIENPTDSRMVLHTKSDSTGRKSGIHFGITSDDTAAVNINGIRSADIQVNRKTGGAMDMNFFASSGSSNNLIMGLFGVDKSVGMYGDLNVAGNITSNNVFVPQYIFSHTDFNQSLIAVNVWTNMTFDQEISDIHHGIEHIATDLTNQTFTIMEDGIYEVDYDFDLEDESPSASDVDIAGRVVLINGTEVIGSVFETSVTKQGISTELSHNFLMECIAGQQLIFQFVASDSDVKLSTHGTFGDHHDSATIIINKISNRL